MNALRTSIRLVIGAAAVVSVFSAGCASGGAGPDPQPYPDPVQHRAGGSGSEYGYSDRYADVIDFHDKKLEFEGPINKDETLTIAPYRNQIEIDGKRVKRVPDLNNKHVHRIFFEREADHARDRRDR